MNKIQLMPPQASERAAYMDALFWTISGLVVFFTAVVGVVVLSFVIKYRAGSKASRKGATDHNPIVELSAMAPMLVLALGMFAWSATNFVNYRKPFKPGESAEVFVIGKQWMWHVQHMNGIRENNELHIPVGKEVTLTMISQDVIHSMYLPEFRVQYHVVPGRYTRVTFKPTMTGKFKMLCAMHCGTQHSEMVGQVYVLSERDYADWLKKGGNRFQETALTMQEAGRQTFEQKGCGNCHTGKDSERAPTLVGIHDTMRAMNDGPPAKADDEYLRDSLVNPWRQVTKGYDLTMPAYKGQLTEEQVLQLVTYMRSLTAPTTTDGTKVPYERPTPASEPGASGRTSAADEANKVGSAGNTQFSQSEMKK